MFPRYQLTATLLLGAGLMGCSASNKESTTHTSKPAATDGSNSTAGDAGSPPASGKPPPADSAALGQWLDEGAYLDFPSESAVHPSSGPHGFVKVFLDDVLVQSLQAGSSRHPVGAAAIKEVYDGPDGALRGWAVGIKTADLGTKDDWYWYERVPRTRAATTSQNGAPVCVSCHQGGRDYVLTDFPLQ
jgi:hypothetical protein